MIEVTYYPIYNIGDILWTAYYPNMHYLIEDVDRTSGIYYYRILETNTIGLGDAYIMDSYEVVG